MDDFYRHDPSISCADSGNFENLLRFEGDFQVRRNETEICASEMSDLIKAQIASHPKYPSLVSAYIECRKVRKRRPKDPKRDGWFFFLLYVNHCVAFVLLFLFLVGRRTTRNGDAVGGNRARKPPESGLHRNRNGSGTGRVHGNESGSCFSLFRVGFVNLRGFEGVCGCFLFLFFGSV